MGCVSRIGKGESVPSLAAGFTEVGDPLKVGAGEKEGLLFWPPETPGTWMLEDLRLETVGHVGRELGT